MRACARWVEANCVTGYVSLAKLDCLKSSKRESTPCRLYVGETFPISRRTIFFSSSSFFLCFLLLRARIARIPARKLHRKFLSRAACLLARDSSNQWIFSEKYSCAVPVKGFPTGVTTFSLFSISLPVQIVERMRPRARPWFLFTARLRKQFLILALVEDNQICLNLLFCKWKIYREDI